MLLYSKEQMSLQLQNEDDATTSLPPSTQLQPKISELPNFESHGVLRRFLTSYPGIRKRYKIGPNSKDAGTPGSQFTWNVIDPEAEHSDDIGAMTLPRAAFDARRLSVLVLLFSTASSTLVLVL